MSSGNVVGKEQLRPWLEGILKNDTFPGVYWIDEKDLIFCINWPNNSPQCPEKCQIFKQWAIHRGKFRMGIDKENYSIWKTRLRTALNKSNDFMYLKEESQKQDLPSRVYKIMSKKSSTINVVNKIENLPPLKRASCVPTVVEDFSSLNNDNDSNVEQLEQMSLNKKLFPDVLEKILVDSGIPISSLEIKDYLADSEVLNNEEQMIISPDPNNVPHEMMDILDDKNARLKISLVYKNTEESFFSNLATSCHLHSDKLGKYSNYDFSPHIINLVEDNDPVLDHLLSNDSLALNQHLSRNLNFEREDYAKQWLDFWNALNYGLIIVGRSDGIYILTLTDVILKCKSLQEDIFTLNKNTIKSLQVFDMAKFNKKLKEYEGAANNFPCPSADIYFDNVDGVYLKITFIPAENEANKVKKTRGNLFEEILIEQNMMGIDQIMDWQLDFSDLKDDENPFLCDKELMDQLDACDFKI